MNKRAVIIIAIIIVVALMIGIVAPNMSGKKTETTTENTNGKDSETLSTEEVDSHVQGASDLLTDENTSDSDKKEDQGEETSNSSSSTGSGSSKGASGSKGSKSGSDKKSSEKESSDKKSSGKETTNIPTISFPYTIEGTDLVVEKISSYKGYFIEDGSDKKVSNVAAIVLKNEGDNLEFAGIGISQGERSLGFSASQIPAGATVIVLEQNGASYSSDPYYTATATTKSADKFEMSEKLVSVKDNGKNAITVTNISDKKLSEVKVFFKSYLPDKDAYVGGITYTMTLTDLEPGTSTDVSSKHYESKYSVVLEVQAKK